MLVPSTKLSNRGGVDSKVKIISVLISELVKLEVTCRKWETQKWNEGGKTTLEINKNVEVRGKIGHY